MIRQVEKQDKEAWYALDKHLPESEFDEKVRCGQGYGMLMTSTQVDEDAQHFYRKLRYSQISKGLPMLHIPIVRTDYFSIHVHKSKPRPRC